MFKAIPIKRILLELKKDCFFAIKYIKIIKKKEKIIANTVVLSIPNKVKLKPRYIAITAPRADELDMPRVYGVARILEKIDCIKNPPKANNEPATKAINVRGIL